jgi:hypothetical protein
MCKEMPVIPVNKKVDPKKNNWKKEGQGGGEAQGVADPPKSYTQTMCLSFRLSYAEVGFDPMIFCS